MWHKSSNHKSLSRHLFYYIDFSFSSFFFLRLMLGDSIYKSFLYNSRCEKWNRTSINYSEEVVMVIEHPTRNRYRGIVVWKIEIGHVEDVCLYDERWPTKASVRASAMPSDANANLINFPLGNSVHPDRRRSPLRDIDVTLLVREMSNSISVDSNSVRHVVSTRHLYPSSARVSILLLSRITVSWGTINSFWSANQSIVYVVESISCTKLRPMFRNISLCILLVTVDCTYYHFSRIKDFITRKHTGRNTE